METIYRITQDNSCRFVLGSLGSHPLLVIGLNPSTATEIKPDRTVTRISRLAERNGFDSFLLFNLYPYRTPFPKKLPKRVNASHFQENLEHLLEFFSKMPTATVLACWGSGIVLRPYLIQTLLQIKRHAVSLDIKWLRLGELTLGGHPRHPSRVPYNIPLKAFDFGTYLD